MKTTQSASESIGVYMPGWLARSNKSDRIFANNLCRAIKESGRYTLCKLNLPALRLSSKNDAAKFCADKNLKLIIEHDSSFYSNSTRYKKIVALLSEQVTFVNPQSVHQLAHDKIVVCKLLQRRGIPVLDQKIITSVPQLLGFLEEDVLFVVKPANSGNGAGVRLIKRHGSGLVGYHRRKWKKLEFSENKKEGSAGVRLQYAESAQVRILFSFLLLASACIIFLFPLFGLLLCMLTVLVFTKVYDRGYMYCPVIVETYFNDSETEFSSLRCTVIGDEAVEAIRRLNKKDVVSNVDRGGVLEKYEMSDFQKEIAVAAAQAVGADYAGVDLLVRGNESVIGEVNIGPITLYSEYTGVNTGKLLAEYVMEKCDGLAGRLY